MEELRDRGVVGDRLLGALQEALGGGVVRGRSLLGWGSEMAGIVEGSSSGCETLERRYSVCSRPWLRIETGPVPLGLVLSLRVGSNPRAPRAEGRGQIKRRQGREW